MNSTLSETPPYAPVLIKLLQGVVYSDDNPYWDQLQSYLTPVSEYFGKIGLRVQNYETQGFAYLEQPDPDPDDPPAERLPRLVIRHRLSFKATIFYVLLREQLRQFDASDEIGRLVLSMEELRDLLQPYLPEGNNEVKFHIEVKALVNKTVRETGFLKKLTGDDDNYEVCPIIKAKIDAEMLERLTQKLEDYADDFSDPDD
ncbi:DUF4194 domain-containing protein [cf. Phormidesmis sp. LEGE 11477]|uniref:DUF4194 domain-containing protein n=1 Tax=cf. Phormidesmis sp. LEGE 11477 TaxID=1828680 RepID=UPI00187EF8F5|nr:DUF4194 domain-containing protein [cf. Phormidesmis sp. LEGE 11477]MBE9064826.1 DUF4194 domain-containing protein [cf. Phormidesmis sp. LEGE 11477]